MSKNIILLSDGTGNSNIKDRGTNVFKLYEALDFNGLRTPPGQTPKKQVAFYDDGVGTEEFKPLKIMGGAFGWGLARNVRNLYKRLVQAYDPGDPGDPNDPNKPPRPADKIYLFGFSRGAFTVRTLAGLIASEGILDISKYHSDDELDLAVLELYENYRAKPISEQPFLERRVYKPFMKRFFKVTGNVSTKTHGNVSKVIDFIGVWDTVDAVGLPFDQAADFWNKHVFRFKFPDHKLHEKIKRACHAVSIDEQRDSFHPLLWENADNRIEQVWFPGVHANVGGGYPQQGLSLVALDWMIKRAEAAGLQFIPNEKAFVQDQKYAFDKLYDSRAGVGVYYQYQPRDIAKLCSDNNIKPQIHVSTFQRIGEGILGYAPGNLPDNFDVVQDGDIDDQGVLIKTIHPNSQAICTLVAEHLANSKSVNKNGSKAFVSPLLQQVRCQIDSRHVLYYVFLVFSLFSLFWLLRGDFVEVKSYQDFFENFAIAIQTLTAPDKLLARLGRLLWSDLLLTGGGLLLLIVALSVRRSMARTFSGFWSGLRISIKAVV